MQFKLLHRQALLPHSVCTVYTPELRATQNSYFLEIPKSATYKNKLKLYITLSFSSFWHFKPNHLYWYMPKTELCCHPFNAGPSSIFVQLQQYNPSDRLYLQLSLLFYLLKLHDGRAYCTFVQRKMHTAEMCSGSHSMKIFLKNR